MDNTMTDLAKNLEVLAGFISQPARLALSASFVMQAADAFFHRYQSEFKTNVGNTMTYGCLKRTEDLSIVEISESVESKKDDAERARTGPGPRFPISFEIIGKEQLVLHRHMICHPNVVYWQSAKKQDFADAGHKWSPVRSGLIWSVLKQINRALVEQGSDVLLEDVPTSFEMAEMLRTILIFGGLTLTANHSSVALHAYLQAQKDNFVSILE